MSGIIDLSAPYESGVRGFEQETATTFESDGWNSTTLHFNSHSGTHMDAPLHFDVNDRSIDQIPVSQLVGKAWVVDLRHIGPKQLIEVQDTLKRIDQRFEAGDSLILWTDWSKNIGSDKFRDDLPRISEGLAQWCVDNGVKMLAVEPPSVADVNNLEEVTRIHKILLRGVIIIEGICNVHSLTSNCVELIALPLKVRGCDGAPARVIAIDRQHE